MNETGYNNNFRMKFVLILTIFSLISIVLITALPVSACHYTIGTYEDDYTTVKNEFIKGKILYGRGNAYGYNHPLKLRIKNPNGDIVYFSNESKHVVYGDFFINETAKPGNWYIQLGIYKNGWQWSTDSGRISSFVVEDINYSLSITLDGNGSVYKEPNQIEYTYGTKVNLTAIPENGWSFDQWTGDLDTNDNSGKIVMDSNKIVVAHFLQNKYNLAINIDGNGYVSKDPDQKNYTFGSIVNLTAIADTSWKFDHWSGNISGVNFLEQIIITDDVDITAHFKKIKSNGGGSNNKSPSKIPSIDKNKAPIAIAGGPYYAYPEELIEFNASKSYDRNYDIDSYIWNFCYGTTVEGKIVKHNYSVVGNYSVSLKVIDRHGASDVNETIVIILQPNRPPSSPNISGPAFGISDDEYKFSIISEDEDNDKIRYIINWGDDTQTVSDFIPANESYNINHSWNKSGIFSITVIADDNETVSNNNISIIINKPKKLNIPEETNLYLIVLFVLLILIILFMILAENKRRKKNENANKTSNAKKGKK